jgi:hypothetical protein
MLELMFITNDPLLAHDVCAAGVSRIFVDWEIIGKAERQGHLDTVQSKHSFEDAVAVRRAIPSSELLVRLNPFGNHTGDEVEMAVSAGADLVMLPMFHSHEEVKALSEMLAGRAKIVPLFETALSLGEVDEVCGISGVYEIYVGLNDLHLDLNSGFMFDPLAGGLLDPISAAALSNKLRFGFGGIARVDEGDIPGKMVLGEHVRLRSSSVILSRTFFREGDSQTPREVFTKEIAKLKKEWSRQQQLPSSEMDANAAIFVEKVHEVSSSISGANYD